MTDLLGGALLGTPVYTSPMVPEGQVVRVENAIWFHGRISQRQRVRRKHGRPRNAPRRLKIKYVKYQPELDRALEASK